MAAAAVHLTDSERKKKGRELDMANEVRLQKLLADCGVASRRKAEVMIENGQVRVNGKVAVIGDKVDPKKDKVTVNGKPVVSERNVYYMLHKPRGFITTTHDELDRKCVMQLVSDIPERIYPVGRLDKDSEGMLLMTNDGEFANRMTHPSMHVPKTYRVTVRPSVNEEQLTQLAMGIIGEAEIRQCFKVGTPGHNVYFMGEYSSLFDKNSTAINYNNSVDRSEEGKRQRSFLLDEEYERYTTEPASCCNPVQGDHVVGIVTDGKIMVHRTNCKVAMDEMANHENHIVRARWRPGEHVALLSGIVFTAIDRKGLLQEITRIVTEQMNLNMRAITLEAVEGIVRGIIMLYVLDLDNLNQLISNLEGLKGVEEVRRL